MTGLEYREYAKVLYLSPVLEDRCLAYAVAAVAHELAHIVLGHDILPDEDDYDPQEEAAWELVRRWGFQREADEFRRYHLWRESIEETYVRKLEEKLGLK